MDAKTILIEADAMFDAGRVEEAGRFLEEKAKEALRNEERETALSVLNELTGYYRHSGRMKDAWKSAETMLELMETLHLWGTMDGATVLLNIATIYKEAKKYREAMKLYQMVEEIYQKNSVYDVRYLGLLNNMCVTSLQEKQYQNAIVYGNRARMIAEELDGYEEEKEIVRKNIVAAERYQKELSGIALSKAYYEEFGRLVLEQEFAPYLEEMTVGLVGEGSECFGFDDQLSRDHDYGPSFCIWLSKEIYQKIGYHLNQIYETLPKEYQGISFQMRREQSSGRRGVLETRSFYQKFLGNNIYPESAVDWLKIPESYLAVATNGTVFTETDTEFMRIRKHLLEFYPEDVRKKKIAANLMKMAHCGQVNYDRMSRRGDAVAARLAMDQFIKETLRVVYLLNRKYCPYYKWMWRGLSTLPEDYGVGKLLKNLAKAPAIAEENQDLIEAVCLNIREELYRQDLSEESSGYLETQAIAVTKGIEDVSLRNLPIMMG